MKFKECSVDECTSPVYRRAYCFKHHKHYEYHGDPIASKGDGRARAQAYKYCAKCGEAKKAHMFYNHQNGTLTAYCKPCHQSIMGARNMAVRLARPPKEAKPAETCVFDGCTKDAVSHALSSDIEGWLCTGHWSQATVRNELTPLRVIRKSYINEDYRLCTECEEVQPTNDFYPHTNGRIKQSKCKTCMTRTSRFHSLRRQGRLEEALSVAESMPERTNKKYVGIASNAITERGTDV